MSKNIRPLTLANHDLLLGKSVSVYFNLNNHLWSVKYKGKVIAHVNHISIVPTKFHVGESGRQRVIKAQCKNVHAWINGTVIDFEAKSHLTSSKAVSYNPYHAGYFYTSSDLKPYNNLSPLYFESATRKAHVMTIKELV